ADRIYLDLQTLKPLSLKEEGQWMLYADASTPARASADGRVFAYFRRGASPQMVQICVLEGNKAQGYLNWDSAGHVTPGPDGRIIYSGRGLYTQQAKRIGKEDRNAPYCLPATKGSFYLAIKGSGAPAQPPKMYVELRLAGDERPLLTLNDI